MFGVELFQGSILTTLLIGIPTLLLLYWYGTRNHEYWKKRGVRYVKPLPFLGNVISNFTTPLHLLEQKRYNELGPIYGHFEGNRLLLSVAKPALLREILVKDFQNFNSRRDLKTGDNILDSNVAALTGEDWKRVRSIVTPTFSTGKIKRMLSIFRDCSKTLLQNFKDAAERGQSVDGKRLYGAFTMDVIASSAFSTKIDSHSNPDNEFLNFARSVFYPKISWRFFLFMMSQRLMKLFKISLFAPDATRFFESVTLQIIAERKRTGQVRNDFLQLLIDTAKEVSEEQKWEDKEDIASIYEVGDAAQQMYKYVTKKKLSMDELVGQCIIFFLAGYETTAATLSAASYMLALNPDVQDKLRAEVDAAIKENNGQLTYEAIQSMKYLDNVISETLRMYPPGVRLERLAEADYKLGDTGITVEKGTLVTVPLYSIHRDPKYYPDPERFDPDRFTAEERAKRDQYVYLPFGAGPRNCVGMRFALIEVKVCLAEVISKCIIKKSPKTKIPLEYVVSQQQLLSPKEIIFDVEVRKDAPY